MIAGVEDVEVSREPTSPTDAVADGEERKEEEKERVKEEEEDDDDNENEANSSGPFACDSSSITEVSNGSRWS